MGGLGAIFRAGRHTHIYTLSHAKSQHIHRSFGWSNEWKEGISMTRPIGCYTSTPWYPQVDPGPLASIASHPQNPAHFWMSSIGTGCGPECLANMDQNEHSWLPKVAGMAIQWSQMGSAGKAEYQLRRHRGGKVKNKLRNLEKKKKREQWQASEKLAKDVSKMSK